MSKRRPQQKKNDKQKDSISMKIRQSQTYICHLKHFNFQNVPNLNLQKLRGKEVCYLSMSTFDCIYSIKKVLINQRKFESVFGMKTSLPIVNSHIQFDNQMNFVSLTLAYINGDIQSLSFTTAEDLKRNYQAEVKAYTLGIQTSQNSVRQRKRNQLRYVNDIVLYQGKDISYQLALQTICVLYRKADKIIALNYKGQLKKISAQRMQQTKQSIKFQNEVNCAQIILYNHKQNLILQEKGQQKKEQKLCICFNNSKLNPCIFDLNRGKMQCQKDFKFIKQVYSQIDEGLEVFNKMTFNYATNEVIAFSSQSKILCYFSIQSQGRNLFCFQKSKIKYGHEVKCMNSLQNYLMLTSFNRIFVYDEYEHKIISDKKSFQQLKNGFMIQIHEQGITTIVNKGFQTDEQDLSKQQRKTTSIHIYQMPYLSQKS